MPPTTKKGLTTFTTASAGLIVAFICFNGLHGILDESVGLALSFSAAAIMWSSIAVHYSLKATRILVVYSYSCRRFHDSF